MDTTPTQSFDVELLREVVESNLNLHKYETALYWADKVMTLTGDVEDILLCANCLYHSGQYHRAIALMKNKVNKANPKCVVLTANSYFACKDYEQTISVVTEFLESCKNDNSSVLLTLKSLKERNLISSIHLLLGKTYEAIGNYELAAEQFKHALYTDVYCYEAFDKLIGHHLLNAADEMSLISQLPVTEQCKTALDAELITSMYSLQIKKYAGHHVISMPPELSSLNDNTEVIVNKAERLYYDCHFIEAHKITSEILEKESFNLKCLPLHIALLVELKRPHDLFYLAHQLVDTYPQSVVSWFGVACYYYLIQNNDLARQYFSKATSIDPLFGPAWLAFGHSFAAESEHDQAMAAYSKASHLMKGCHLPFLYIGLEYGLTSTTKLAEKFFNQAKQIAPNDPFVVHEIAVIEFQNGRYVDAEMLMKQALQMVESLDLKRMVPICEPLLNNLAHTCRKLRKYGEAIEYHKRALILSPKNASTFSAIGYNHMLMFDFNEAVKYFHKALSLRKNDTFTAELLNLAIEELVNDIGSDIGTIGNYCPIESKEKLSPALIANESSIIGDLGGQGNLATPHTSIQPSPLAQTPSVNQSNMSVEMDMTYEL